MPKPPRLTREQLNQIQAGNRRNGDVRLLLHEIRLLRDVLNNTWQVLDKLPSGPVNSPLELLRIVVNREPCVQEQRAEYQRASQLENKPQT